MHQKAVDDCRESIRLNPKYSKAYGRLGLACFSLGKYEEAVAEYKKGLELEPNNSSLKESLSAAEKKLQASKPSPIMGGGANPPNFAELLNNPELMNMFGGQGFQNIINNPMFQSMATQMMNNPEMMNLANNLAQNPESLNNMMGGLGGIMGQRPPNPPDQDKNGL